MGKKLLTHVKDPSVNVIQLLQIHKEKNIIWVRTGIHKPEDICRYGQPDIQKCRQEE